MTNVSRSTGRRLLSPQIAALCLAALRLKLHLEPPPRLSFTRDSK